MSLILKYDLGNPHRLPVGYTPLAYIESTGTLWINTNLIINSTVHQFSINISYLFTSFISQYDTLIGSHGQLVIFRRYSTTNNFEYYVNTDNSLGSTPVNIDIKYITHVSALGTSYFINTNGHTISETASRYSGNSSHPQAIILFGTRTGSGEGTFVYGCKARLYSCVFEIENSIVRDFIPAKNSSGVVGLFDCVSQTFFTNQGTGSFIAGPEVVVLPYEYLLVEYLHSDGNQYINTGYIPGNNNLVIDMIGTTDTNAPSTNRSFYGGASSGVWNPLFNVCNGHWEVGFGGYWAVGTIPSTGGYYITKLTATNGTNQTFVVNGETLVNNGSRSYTATNGPVWFLFKINNGFPIIGSIHYMKITENGTVVREYIPCYRRADMKPGMYDLVNKVFYTNSGSGEFILGPVVEESSRQLEYNLIGMNLYPNATSRNFTTSSSGAHLLNRIQNLGFNGYPGPWTISFDAYSTANVNVTADICDLGGKTLTITPTKQHFYVTATAANYYTPGNYNGFWDMETNGPNSVTIYLSNITMIKGSVTDTVSVNTAVPINVKYSPSAPTGIQGSGDFSGGAKIIQTIPALGNSFSISWWANGTYGGTMMWGIYPFNPLYNLCLNVGDGNENPWYRPRTTTQITAPSNNVWHHFVVTGDGSSNKLYVDGVHYGTSKTYRGCSGTSLILNGWNMSSSYNWNGKMCDFRIYNNVLTADEVLQIYKRGL